MCTKDEGDELLRVFGKYYHRRRVDDEDRPPLDHLYSASFIDYSYSGDTLYAEASAIGRQHKWRLFGRRTRSVEICRPSAAGCPTCPAACATAKGGCPEIKRCSPIMLGESF